MKIQTVPFQNMHNDEHFQFHTEFIELVNRAGASNLRVEALFEAYLPSYHRADEALKKIPKSTLTEEINKADNRRDNAYQALAGKNRASLKDFRPEFQQAAKKLSILFNTYGNVSRNSLVKQTSGIYNLMQELRGDYAEALHTLGLQVLADELEAANHHLSTLYRQRLDETTQKTKVVLRQERKNMDTTYRQLIERLNARVVLEGEPTLYSFIDSLNTLITKYKTLMAQRAGKAKAKRESASSLPPVVEETDEE